MNKTFISICTLLVWLNVTSAFSQTNEGIIFQNISLRKALNLAQQEKKLVFIDCYTTWCGPCKKLSSEVFTKKEIGDYFNQSFICLKMDMDREGANVKSKYDIRAYPSLLFLDHQGTVIHKIIGYRPYKILLEEAKKANNPEKNMHVLSEKFKQGVINSDVINNELQNCKDPVLQEELLNKYFRSIDVSNWTDSSSWEIIRKHVPITSKLFKFLLSNQEKFDTLYGKIPVEAVIQSKFAQYYIKESSREKRMQTIDYLDNFNSPLAVRAVLNVETSRNMNGVMANLRKKDAWHNFLLTSGNLNKFKNNEGLIFIRQLSKQVCKNDDNNIPEIIRTVQATNSDLSPTMCEYLNYYRIERIIFKDKLSQKDVDTVNHLTSQIIANKIILNSELCSLANSMLENKNHEKLVTNAEKLSLVTLAEEKPAYHETYAVVCERLGNRDTALKSMETALEIARKTQPEKIHYYQNRIERFKTKQTFF